MNAVNRFSRHWRITLVIIIPWNVLSSFSWCFGLEILFHFFNLTTACILYDFTSDKWIQRLFKASILALLFLRYWCGATLTVYGLWHHVHSNINNSKIDLLQGKCGKKTTDLISISKTINSCSETHHCNVASFPVLILSIFPCSSA